MTDHADLQQLLALARQATSMACKLIRERSVQTVTKKGDRDLASDVDLDVEHMVRDFLQQATPHIGFLGEESGSANDSCGERQWVLDPIDGTINFLHGLPLCAVSLSLLEDDKALIGVIELPFLEMQYTACLGQGSFADDQQLSGSKTTRLDDALVSIDQYTFGLHGEERNRIRRSLVENLSRRVQRVRMLGASAVDLAWTAQGRLDACIILGNKPWDTCAGVLIAREAGVRVIDIYGTEHTTKSLTTVAVTPSIEHDLMALIGEIL